MADDSKPRKYRRPDGSTYTQAFGPKSAQDVEVKEEAKPAPSPTPSPSAGAGKVSETKAPNVASPDYYARRDAEAAQRAAESAETTEKVAPWLLEKPKQVEGGLGGASARQREKLSKVSAEKAGDAMAETEEERKKREKAKAK